MVSDLLVEKYEAIVHWTRAVVTLIEGIEQVVPAYTSEVR